MGADNRLEYELLEPLTYLHEGETYQAKTLVFYPPNNQTSFICANLEQWFYSALKDNMNPDDIDKEAVKEAQEKAAKDAEEGIEKDIPPKEVVGAIMMGSSHSAAEYMAEFEKLCVSKGICKIDDQVQMTKILWGNMGYKDTKNALGEYVANFLLK